MPKLPLIWSEFNASYKNEPDVTDAPFMGPWLANTIRECDGIVDMMSYWTFSDVFEEQGISKTPFYGGFGLIADDDRIPKAAFNAFQALCISSETSGWRQFRRSCSSRDDKRKYAIALWNYAPPEHPGFGATFTLHFTGYSGSAGDGISRRSGSRKCDEGVRAMGRPASPSQQADRSSYGQRRRTAAAAAVWRSPKAAITLTLPSYGLAVIRVQ